jgi:hypothetical protein
MKLHTLYTQLEASIQSENEEIAVKRKDSAGYSRLQSDTQVDALANKSPRQIENRLGISAINFQRYGRSIRGLPNTLESPGRKYNPSVSNAMKQIGYPRASVDSASDSGSFNCGQPGHRAYSPQCQKEVDNIRINANRVKRLDNKYGTKQSAARVLFEISTAQNEFELLLASLPNSGGFDKDKSGSDSFVNFTRMMTCDEPTTDGEPEAEHDASTHFSLLSSIENHRNTICRTDPSPFVTEN